MADRDYELAIGAEDLAALELDTDRQPQLDQVLVLALLSLHDGFSATANLMAPIVINLRTRRGLQAIRCDSLYSYQHVLPSATEREFQQGGHAHVLRRKAGESLLIGDDIEVELLAVRPKARRSGFHAPRQTVILRKELKITQEENAVAAQGLKAADLASAIKKLRG